MPKYKVIVEYDGAGYRGWQIQANAKTVCGDIKAAIFAMTQETPEITASGRTDAGVHARGQVIDFSLKKDFEPYQIIAGINAHLFGTGVCFVECETIGSEFSSRYSAKKRHYQYRIINRVARSILEEKRAWHISADLDLEAMGQAAKQFIGKHNFTSFRSSDCQAKNPVRTIDTFEVKRDGEFIIVDVSAKAFLHNQVRNMVGAIVEVGKGKLAASDILKIISLENRIFAPATAPAWGLYFMKVDY
jgi:tRNA pseudouridine38-40 synthase